MYNIFEAEVLDSNIKGYQAQVFPELFPKERQAVISNWHPEDLVMFCGGEYAKNAYQNNSN